MATKTVPAKKIKIALQEGETLIGENKVQALKLKREALQSVRIKPTSLVICNVTK